MKSWVNPKWRAATFLVLANLAWMSAAWLWVERENWLWMTPIALSINFLLLTYDQVLSFSGLESRALMGHDSWGVLKTVHRLSEHHRVTPPRVFIVDHPSAQVFGYGRTRASSRLYISRGAIELLSPEELDAVLTFQILSISRSLTIINYWVGAVLDLFFRLGRGVERSFAVVFGWTPPLAYWMIRPVMWLMKLLLLSTRDFERLDRDTGGAISRPEDLARALWKMESYARTRPWRDAVVFSHMCMVSPLSASLQPPVPGRIRQLIGRYPL